MSEPKPYKHYMLKKQSQHPTIMSSTNFDTRKNTSNLEKPTSHASHRTGASVQGNLLHH